jgi:hypothetical protein
MNKRLLRLRSFLAVFTLVTLFSLLTANAQQSQPQAGAQAIPRDNDTTRGELANFDRFMDSHPEIADQLRRDPSLVKNEDFVRDHHDLQEYLQQHPGVREEISENPDRFMRQEQHFDRAGDRRDRDEGGRDFDRPEDRRDNGTRVGELASFDRFMDGHPEIAEQLRRDPSLVKNQQFVQTHPALQDYLQQHPGVQQEISENPDRFMRQEQRFDRREDQRDEGRGNFDRPEDRRDNDSRVGELASFDRFMDSHREISEQLRRDPSLVKNEEFVRSHPALQEYLQQHPAVQQEISENPDRFMRQEQRFDRHEDRHDFDRVEDRRDEDRRDNDSNDSRVGELANFDRFMDSHPEISEQLRRDPSLVKNEEFVRNHPALQEYLQQHPEVHEQISENPNRFMRQEQRFDRVEDSRNHDMADGDRAAFGQFLGSHGSIAEELSKEPWLANNQDYQKSHPDLQQYLKTHPGVQAQLKQDPQTFMKSTQQFGSTPAPRVPSVDPAPKAPSLDPMPKQ